VEPLRDAVIQSENENTKNTNIPPVPTGTGSPTLWRKLMGQPGVPLPLYQCTTTKANGEVRETMWGPSAVQGIRWLVVLILGAMAILILKDGSAAPMLPFLKWLTAIK
jgi:hypothetical protein